MITSNTPRLKRFIRMGTARDVSILPIILIVWEFSGFRVNVKTLSLFNKM